MTFGLYDPQTLRPYDLQTFRPYNPTTFPRNFFHFSRVFSLQVVWYLQDFFSKFASPKKRKSRRTSRPEQLAEVAELVDALDSKSSGGNTVWVRVPPSVHTKAVGREVYPDDAAVNKRSESYGCTIGKSHLRYRAKKRAENCKNKIYCYLCPTLKKNRLRTVLIRNICRNGGIGRRARFRGVCPYGRGGSTPPFGTDICNSMQIKVL